MTLKTRAPMSLAYTQELGRLLPYHTSLRALSLMDAKLNDETVRPIIDTLRNPSTSLQQLLLADNLLSDVSAISLAQALEVNQTLTCLSLAGNGDVALNGTSALAHMLTINSTLLHLDLNECNLASPAFPELLKALTHQNHSLLTLQCVPHSRYNFLTEEDLQPFIAMLGNNNTLTSVRIDFRADIMERTRVDGMAESLAAALHHNTTLTEIDFGGLLQNDQVIGLVFSKPNLVCPSLTALHLALDHAIAPESEATIINGLRSSLLFPSLASLKLTSSSTSPLELNSSILHHPSLTSLQLDTTLHVVDQKCLALSLRQHQHLAWLTIETTPSSQPDEATCVTETAQLMAQAFAQNTSLTCLNCLGSLDLEVASSLVSSLQQNRSLTMLNFRWATIEDSVLTTLSQALQRNHTLTELRLDGDVGDRGITALGEAVSKKCQPECTLTRLHIAHVGNLQIDHLRPFVVAHMLNPDFRVESSWNDSQLILHYRCLCCVVLCCVVLCCVVFAFRWIKRCSLVILIRFTGANLNLFWVLCSATNHPN
jgi:hypothetical protein